MSVTVHPDCATCRAALYQRISYDLAGDEHGVANQRADQERAAAARGYTVVMSASDNDISALAGKHRPGYAAIMAAAQRGEIDVIIVFQTSRFWRNRKERAEGIEVLRRAGVSIIATKGPSLDMSTAYGRMMAGLLGEFDTGESEIKAERQQLANHAAAVAGKARKEGPRPFGWLDDRVTLHPAESAAVRDGSLAIIAGGTVTGVRIDWARRGLRPRLAPFGPLPENPWHWESVRAILLNPRNAGLMVYQGAEIGRGEWEPIVPEDTWRDLRRKLRPRESPAQAGQNPSRSSSGITTLLGKLARCRCGNLVGGAVTSLGHPAYRCIQSTRRGRKGPHVQIRRPDIDVLIGRLVVARLTMPDAAHLIAPPPGADPGALAAEAAAIRKRLASLGRLFAAGKIDEEDLVGGRDEGSRRLAVIEAELEDAGRENVLAPLVLAEDATAMWESYTIDRRRAVVSVLMDVTIYPTGPGSAVFRPEVTLPVGRGIRWKTSIPGPSAADFMDLPRGENAP